MSKCLWTMLPTCVLCIAVAAPAQQGFSPAQSVAAQYCQAIGKGDVAAAYALLSAKSKQKWPLEKFAKAVGTGEGRGEGAALEEPMVFLLLTGKSAAQAGVARLIIAEEDVAYAEAHFPVSTTRTVCLVAEMGHWKVDFEATDRAWALQDATDQLRAVRSLLGMMFGAAGGMAGEGAPFGMGSLVLRHAERWQSVETKATDPQHTQVTLRGEGTLRIAFPLTRKANGWTLIDGGGEPVLMRPGETLEQAVERIKERKRQWAEEPWAREGCAERMAGLAEAMLRWLASNPDEPFPEVESFNQLIDDYLGEYLNTRVGCPALDDVEAYGVGFNANLIGKRFSEIANPQEVVMFFEIPADAKKTVGGPEIMLREPRHDEGIVVAYVSGEVEYKPAGAELCFVPEAGKNPIDLAEKGMRRQLLQLAEELELLLDELREIAGEGG